MGNRLKRVAETWHNRRAIAYSSSPGNLSFLLKDVLSKRDWKLNAVTSSVDEAFLSLSNGDSALLIIDDCPESPASLILRQQLFNPVAAMTPTIVLSSEKGEAEIVSLKSIGKPALVKKPLTPKDLLSSFDRLFENWSSGYLSEIYKATMKMQSGQAHSGFKILTEIVQSGELSPLASSTLSLHYRLRHDLTMTEKVLTAALRQGIFEMTIILPLIDLYLYSSCPGKALKLIGETNKVFHNPTFLCIDAIQANIMVNRLDDCIPYLKQMLRTNYYSNVARLYLERILYSCGKLDDFDKSIKFRPERFDEYQRAWHLLDESSASTRKNHYVKIAQTKKAKAREERMNNDLDIEREIAQQMDESVNSVPIGQPFFKKIPRAS